MKKSASTWLVAWAFAWLCAAPSAHAAEGLELANLRAQVASELADLKAGLGKLAGDLERTAAEDPDYRDLLYRAETIVARLSGLEGALHDLLGDPDASLGALQALARDVERSWAAYHRVKLVVEAAAPDQLLAAAAGTGSISGRLIDAVSGDGVAGQRVRLTDDAYVSFPAQYSDGTGAFYFGGLADGTYYLHTSGNLDYIAEIYDDIPCDGYCDPLLGTPIPVTAGAQVSGIDQVLDRAGKVLGRVTGADSGLGLRDVSVRLYEGCDNLTWTRTDATGRYELGGLSTSSTYRVAVFPPNHYIPQLYDGVPWPGGCDLSSGTPVPVEVNAITAGVDFSVERGGVIEGTVTHSVSGAPLAGTTITVYRGDGINLGWDVHTDALGRYATVVGLEAGDYYVRARPPYGYLGELYDDVPCPGFCDPTTGTLVTVPDGATVSGIDFSIDQGARIEGAVAAADTGLALVSVPVRVFNGAGVFIGSDYSFAGGAYRIDDIEPGTFFLTAGGSGAYVAQLYDGLPCPSSSCEPNTGTPVTASLNTVTSGIDFVLPRGGSISGTVTDGPSGAPIFGVTVQVYVDGSGYLPAPGQTDGIGRFAVEGLDTGDHFAEAVPGAPPHLPELYQEIAFPGYDDPWDGTPISVVEGTATTGVDFTLDRGGTVTGTVRAEGTGEALSGVGVDLYDQDGYRLASGGTDSLGSYEIIGLAPGTVFARTYGGYSLYFDELYSELPCFDGCDATSGTPIPVAVNATTPGIDFSLTRGGLLIVRVRDALTGQPLPGVRVVVSGAGGYWESSYTGSSGVISTRGLQAGDYRVTATKSGYHGQRFDGFSCADGCETLQATPIPIGLGIDRTVELELFPWGLDPDLRISHETVCLGDFTSCGSITLGPSLELCGSTTFTAAQSVIWLDDVWVSNQVGISTDASLGCP